jgi:cleavage and polyadenylation specificity factor subunit 1
MGALLQKRVKNVWQPLAFSKKLSPTQQKYGAYDCELLAIYEAVRNFRHMREARHFVVITNHKPLTYTFQQKRDRCSPWQFNHRDFVAQFTTDIQHNSGQDNVVANAVSRVKSVTAPPSYDARATSQDSDGELQILLGATTAVRFEKLPIPGTAISISCKEISAVRSSFPMAPSVSVCP